MDLKKPEPEYGYTNAQIMEILATYPDKLAFDQAGWKNAGIDRDVTFNRLFLSFKAKAVSAGAKINDNEIKAEVRVSDEYCASAYREIALEAVYTKTYETLMSAKKIASLRSAF